MRTAIGTFNGTIKDVPAIDFGTTVAQEVFNRSGLDSEQVDEAIVGNPAKEVLVGNRASPPKRASHAPFADSSDGRPLKEVGRTTK